MVRLLHKRVTAALEQRAYFAPSPVKRKKASAASLRTYHFGFEPRVLQNFDRNEKLCGLALLADVIFCSFLLIKRRENAFLR